MNTTPFGIAIITTSALVFWLSYKYYRKENFHISIGLIILGGFLLRYFAGADLFLHEWDEKYHALVAKNLLKHPFTPLLYENPLFEYDYKNWSGNHVWLSKPIFPLWLMSASIYLFGNNEIAIRLPSLILSTTAIFLTFQIGKNLFDSKIGLLASFFHAIHGLLLELCGGRISSDHVETAFSFFIELSILFCILSIVKNRSVLYITLAGVSLGISLMSKWVPGFIVVPVWLSMAVLYYKSNKRLILGQLILLCAVSLIIALPWHLYMYSNHPLETKWMLNHFLSPYNVTYEDHAGEWWYYIDKIRMLFGEAIYIPIVWFLWRMWADKSNYRLAGVGTWWSFALIVFSVAQTKRHTYMMIAAPAFFIISSLFFYYCLSIYHTFKHKWLLITVMVAMIALPVRFSIERLKPFDSSDKDPAWARGLKAFNTGQEPDNILLFNTSRYVEAMFYTGYTSYWFRPDETQIKSLKEKGYRIFVCTNDNVQSFEEIK